MLISLNISYPTLLLLMIALTFGCSSEQSQKNQTGDTDTTFTEGTFGYDLQFLEKHTKVNVLKNDNGQGQILVTPEMQGRVMTSTVNGLEGRSLGWVNNELIASGEIREHFTPYGGEDRFWLGPEGGQYSIFFEPGTEITFENWYVPPAINTEPWNLVTQQDQKVTVEKKMQLTNFQGNAFDLHANRTISILDKSRMENLLDITLPRGINQVAFETSNSIKNTGEEPWTRSGGALSIWILSMFSPSPGVTVAIPFKKGSEEKLGPVVTTEYFGEISDKRLKIEDGMIYYHTDGKKRSKLGVGPRRAKPVAGSYDPENNMLTIMHFTLPENNFDYVNSLWKHQEKHYGGDVVNAYNDGPLEDGSQMGPFFEMESSSPAAFLAPDESISHDHRIFHFSGNKESLNRVAESVLGITIQEIESAF